MKSKYFVIGLFGFWLLFILGMFLKYSLNQDPFFGTARNIVNRHQPRGEIKDRYGEILAQGNGSARKYALGAMGSPVIGVARPNIGVEGVIERQFGERLIRSRKSKVWYIFNQRDEGYPLTTTLDKNLQAVAYRAMKNYTGAMVVMKMNGEILASISSPTYDPNKMNARYYNLLKKHPEKPLFNRAFDGQYEPGSVWKLVVAATLLEENFTGTPVVCNGSIKVGDKNIHCMQSHGNIKNMEEAMTVSCNIWFIQSALNELNPQKMKKSFSRFMSHPMKEDMTQENMAMAAIGQGDVLVSPVELAQLAAAIGNRGKKPEVRLAKENLSSTQIMDEKIAAKISAMMEQTVKKGTARGLADFQKKGFLVAAKTGTAERDTPKGKINTALLAGFVGSDKTKPDFAFSVVIEDSAGYGGTICVPIIKEVLDFHFARKR